MVDLTLLILVLCTCIISYPASKNYRTFRKTQCAHHIEGGHEHYEDDDGCATEESENQYAEALRPRFILALEALGLAISLMTIILMLLSNQPATSNFLVLGIWVGLFMKAETVSD